MKAAITTADLYFAAYLCTVGLPYTTKPTGNPSGKIHFVFEADDADEARSLQTGWFDASAKVSAQEYATKVKMLKSLVHVR